MEVMFSNNNEELANQVDNDIKSAKDKGEVDTEEVNYKNLGDGNIAITDKENGEVTLAQSAEDTPDTYDLIAVPDGQLEKYLHPSEEGKKGVQVGVPDEKVENHLDGKSVISPNLNDGGLNPEAGHEKKAVDTAEEGPTDKDTCPGCGKNPCECEGEDEEKEFSVSTDNTVVMRIFSDQEFCERIFSEVIESEETAKVGDLKIEKVDDAAVVVTDITTGDQAKVDLDDDEMNVTELDSKEFSDDELFC
jgi:nitrogen regulatory protein PII